MKKFISDHKKRNRIIYIHKKTNNDEKILGRNPKFKETKNRKLLEFG